MGQKLKVGDRVRLSAHGLRLSPESQVVKEYYLASGWGKALKRPRDVYKVQEIMGSKFVNLGKRTNRWLFKKGPLTGYWIKRDWIKKA